MDNNPKHDLPWWQTGVYYNLYVRSFLDTNGDGIGDLTGVIEKLGYLQDTLGVDVLWLSGMLASPWLEFGFDVSDTRNIHPAFGKLETFDELLHAAHQRGMRVVIDYIPNHTSHLHTWFLESCSSRDNPKRDWYIWADPKPDGTPPNNWLSLFGGPSWEWDPDTAQYYLHTFLKEQPELNWRNPELKEAMFNEARFWLNRGVDGFRVDAAHHLMKDPNLRDNPPKEPRDVDGKRMAHEYQEHKWDREHPDLHDVYRQLRDVLDEYASRHEPVVFCEVHPSGGWERWAEYYGGEALDEFHFPLNNGFIGTEWTAEKLRELVDSVEEALPSGAWPNAHTGNFDEWRIATKLGQDGARLAAMLLLTLRGAPMLYYGEEIGMTNVAVPPDLHQDPMGKRIGLNRDTQRTPMQWDASPHAGFSPHTTPRLWLPVSSNYRQINVENQLHDPQSMLSLYRRLIALRKATPALLRGSYRAVDPVPKGVFAYLRQLEDQRALVALNFSEQPQALSFPTLGAGEVALNTALDHSGAVDLGDLRLRSKEGVVILMRKM